MAVTVAVDAGGADLGPAEVAAGAALAAARGVRVLIFGSAAELGEPAAGVEIVDAPVSIAKAVDPVSAVRSSPESSIVQAARAVASGDADALVSGGSTGAALAAGLFEIKRARGIYRPALAMPVPVPGNPITLLDVGANAEVRPEHLTQFAFMGAAFAATILGIEHPRVALLSNGEEASKGTPALIEAHAQLQARAAGSELMQFLGNVEGTDLTTGVADVIVTDGFTGNVAIKLMEGVSQTILGAVREAALSTTRSKLGGALLRPALGGLREDLNPEAYGGAYLLGLRRLGVIPHGRFGREGIAEAIVRAARGVEGELVERTHVALDAAGALKSRPPAATSGAAASVTAE